MGTCITRQDDCADQKNVDSYDVQCVVSSEDMRVDKFTIITSTPSQQQEITKQSQVNDEKVYRSRPHYLEDTDTSDQESSCSEESDEFDTDMEDCLKEMVTLLDNGYIPSNTKNNEWGNIASMISYNSYLNFKKDSSKINELCALIEDSFEDQLAHLIGISSDIVDDDQPHSFSLDEEIVQHVGGNFTQNRLEEHDDSRRKYERLSLQMFPEEIIYRREIERRKSIVQGRIAHLTDKKQQADSSKVPAVSSFMMHSSAGSKQLETLMGIMGYSKECIDYRVVACRERDRILSNTRDSMTRITVGSKAEGVACWLESDYDVMLVSTDILCVESDIIKISNTNHKTILEVRSDACYPGYCLLDLKYRGEACLLVTENVFSTDTNGNKILGSEAFIDNAPDVSFEEDRVLYPRSGPSFPVSDGPLRYDLVYALRCLCPSILKRWAKRPRVWPPNIIVEKVVRMGGYVVPVGFKGSDNKHMEWRICFTTGETELVRNLNDILIKVYVLLKMIVRDVLKPKNKEITSYVVKNLVMWLAERSPTEMFSPDMLLYWLRVALNELKTAIKNTNLNNYMIPERNLLECCGLTDKQKITWEAIITEMIKEGPKLLIRLSKFRRAIIAYPEPLLTYCKWKILLEVLVIEDVKRRKELDPNNELPEMDILLVEERERFKKNINKLDPNNTLTEQDNVLVEVNERIEKILINIQKALKQEGWVINYEEILVKMLS
ncbi:uncharacterized protein LOC127846613 [Dreissena polymorpha]|nr:uncharacterized protein LOC127846613 [Dreissena polymorpha]